MAVTTFFPEKSKWKTSIRILDSFINTLIGFWHLNYSSIFIIKAVTGLFSGKAQLKSKSKSPIYRWVWLDSR